MHRRAPKRGGPDRPFVYRLRRWPDLRDEFRVATVLRALSRMSAAPVTHRWFAEHCGLHPAEADSLLQQLYEDGCVLRLDLEKLASSERKETS